ncbi:hypothetical protein Pmani_033709 [Petrolisthes manimaculis]|uniref:Protein SPT2 homolog n=1 Tax=Petrolisthes manimaculis TaxID=1843537 RepID=A0AAE1NP69_9EUCA|nr:hypothetical protein Pmani_033709 [Petrolisthes manimaculis]
MDFSYLIELARNNDKSNAKEASKQRFSTKVTKPKKIEKPGPKVSAVQAVLKKLEDDKHKENEEFKAKKKNLLTLRAQDRKSNKRVKAMINMSKGASKAVLEEAKDLTTAKGEEQCDEDDYGYESTMSQNIFKKLAGEYADSPLDDKLKFSKNSVKGATDINDIKSRVINSLKKKEEEEMGPRKRKRKRKNSGEFEDFINDGDAYDESAPSTSEKSAHPSTPREKVVNVNLTNYKSDKHNNFKYDQDSSECKSKKREREREEEKFKKPKPKPKPKAGPPPMSFEELLRVAKNKQKNPLPDIREEKLKEKEKKDKKKELDRPLTAKEKEELEDERRRKLKRLGKLPPEKKEESKDTPSASDKQTKNGENKHKQSGSNKLREQLESPKPEPKVVDRSKYFAVPFAQKSNSTPQNAKAPPPQLKQQPPKLSQSKVQPPSIRQEPLKSAKPQKPSREMPPQRDMKPGKPPQKFPQKDRGRPFPPPDMQRRPPSPQGKRRIESDDESEYDSELDDFIDDGDAEVDYRSEIGKLFGYDRNKYKDDEDDLSDMEASYSQMQKEERISAKIGLKEDLEDIQREEEEKKMKMKRLKMMKKQRR